MGLIKEVYLQTNKFYPVIKRHFKHENDKKKTDYLTKYIEIEKVINSKYIIPISAYHDPPYKIVFKIKGHADIHNRLSFYIPKNSSISFLKFPKNVIPLRISLNYIGIFKNIPDLVQEIEAEYDKNQYIYCSNCKTKILKNELICQFCGYKNK